MNAAVHHHPALLSFVPTSDVAKADLVSRMGQPQRFYHNLAHLDLLWSRHLAYRAEIGAGREVSCTLVAAAIAYHDAVYVAGAGDNEERSAELWLEVSATGLEPAERLWVADTIRATANHLGAARAIDVGTASGYARQWVLDLDLSPLGEEPDVFDRNMDLLRAEAGHGSAGPAPQDLTAGLRHFASARPLYRCRPIASAFGKAAQRNFSRHLVATPADTAAVR